ETTKPGGTAVPPRQPFSRISMQHLPCYRAHSHIIRPNFVDEQNAGKFITGSVAQTLTASHFYRNHRRMVSTSRCPRKLPDRNARLPDTLKRIAQPPQFC